MIRRETESFTVNTDAVSEFHYYVPFYVSRFFYGDAEGLLSHCTYIHLG